VHLADWPAYDASKIDEKLNHDMALVMRLVSLGHAARNKANRKVRQPLAEAAFSAGSAEELQVLERYGDLIEDELNVKKIRALSTASEAVDFNLNPLPKQLGQKYGSRFPQIRQGIMALQADAAAQKLMAGQPVSVVVNGESFDILPEEVEVRVQAHAGFAVASEGAYLAALVTDLTPELVSEGLARELVRRVQDLRKQADLDIADRITLYYTASEGLKKAIHDFKDYLMGETLTVNLVEGAAPEGAPSISDTFDGETVTVAVKKV
jgi:isoleucyl-tRNA synthetase